MKPIVILHQQLTPDSSKDELDVMAQVEAVEKALTDLGFPSRRLAFGLDLAQTIEDLRTIAPLAAFNLVESVAGDGRMISMAPAILDHLGIPYTGCTTDAFTLTTNKVLCKKWLRLSCIRTPDWVDLDEEEANLLRRIESPFIIKSVWEHASAWFSDDSIVTPKDLDHLLETLRDTCHKNKGAYFAERFVDGREFNVSILAGRVLAIPEMVFLDFPKGKPQVVDFKAKWEEESFEYRHTQRRFDLPAEDRMLLSFLQYISLACWKLFRMRGFARVDFRVDRRGIPWVLEVNANPCLSPDAGFLDAALQSGLNPSDVVRAILQDSGIRV